MHFRQALPALAVVLAASAAWGPQAAAAPGEGGGAAAGTPTTGQPAPAGGSGGSGGGAYGESAPKPKHRRRHRAPTTATATGVHRFPIAGAFDWGGPDARFGAKRKGHSHQGQDLPAAAGTPVVAPYRGVVTAVQYQAGGAGRYVVLDGEDYDYVFMHLRTGSIVVREGERVRTGQAIGEVGSTGESSGPHLHFELWEGVWYDGGHPIDPLPLLQQWASPASG
jgi:murein DD-endopeptidase MepM/ murein hydrolase activator NlpD